MINKILHIIIYTILFVVLQVFFMNNIHFFRVATPFIYLYVLLKLPIGTSTSKTLIFAFMLGLTIDIFSNTQGMHAAACCIVAFLRNSIINLTNQKELETKNPFPRFYTMGRGGFFYYLLIGVLIHHSALYIIESLSLLDPLFLIIRIGASTIMTTVLLFLIEALNPYSRRHG